MKFIKAKIWSIVLVLVVIVVSLFFIFKNGNYTTIKVERGDLEKITEISGKVVPTEEVELSFGVGGIISKIYKNVGNTIKAGDLLAILDIQEINSEIEEANALLRSESAKFVDLNGENTSSELNFKKDAFIKTLNKAVVNADGIIKNQVDIFFEDPDSRFPEFSMTLGDYFVRQDLGSQRFMLEKMLATWKNNFNGLSSSNVSISDGEESIKNLRTIENFLSIIAKNSFRFEPAGDVTQSQIDSYLSTISTARSTIASLIIEINTSADSLREVESQVPIQSAIVENTRATVSKLISRSNNYEIRAPFEGTVTSRDSEVGQVVSSGEKVLTLISNSPLEIEAFIPEINIVGVDVGDPVKVSFDALGKENKYDAVVSEVEPKETIKDGVVTYKIRVDLINENKDLKPGMSSDMEIKKDTISNQLIIPTYVVIKEGNENFVNLLKDKKVVKTKIEISDKDNRGNFSVASGLSEGDEIVVSK